MEKAFNEAGNIFVIGKWGCFLKKEFLEMRKTAKKERKETEIAREQTEFYKNAAIGNVRNKGKMVLRVK